MRRITHLVLHHTGSDHSTKESIWRTHVLQKKWRTWGYHVGFQQDGDVDELRPEHTQGAHTAGFNYHTLGGVLYGNLDKHTPTSAQYAAAVARFAHWCRVHALDPMTAILGHRETRPFVPKILATKKPCPGKYVDMDRFRRDVADRLKAVHGA